MSIPKELKKLILYLPALFCLILFVVYGLVDYWIIGVIADPVEISRYNFGAEAMIAHGGEKYRSSNAYAISSLVIGMLSVIGMVASLFMLYKSKHKALLKAYCCSGVTLLAVVLVGHAW
ncbi:hypothetical protein Q4490_11475 [Neptunomonas phycophila]|uniref:DUF998 domain-containing protein n=1 Tax=Neptunomonas phycophila TaxID=1572645 RepID=A0AAW7XID3_9GAMM|nr:MULTISPECIES: hypothetical protein [Neptunomonas]MDN2658355.1 hypothetical protein [Neptunomonas sp. CHC150]MDO6454181.1 hypothetical protein [Neptunomonas phycophila]